jgi:DNA-binding transcriptional regulator YhcF (GntR family)
MARHDQRDLDSSDSRRWGAAHSDPQSRPPSRPAHNSPSRPPSTPTRAPGDEPQLDLDDLAIDRTGEIPIGVQLAWALRARIGDGRLAPGRRLPGLRELAEMLGINANTARAVYQRLEQEGLIDSRQGTGTFVASLAPEPSPVGQIAADAARQARRTGVDPREVAAALYVSAKPPGDTSKQAADASAQAAERRRELRTQIAALEQTLSEIQARHPGLIPAPLEQVRQAGPRLLSAEELERVRTQLVQRLAEAKPLLETTAQNKAPNEQAAARERRQFTQATAKDGDSRQPAQATTEDADSRQPESTPAKKPARPRARTRPYTA